MVDSEYMTGKGDDEFGMEPSPFRPPNDEEVFVTRETEK